jgi:hypothetical protein
MPEINSEQANNASDRKDEKEPKKINELNFQFQTLARDGEIIFLLEGVEVFRLFFYPDNYAKAFFEKVKPDEPFLMISEDQRRRLHDCVRKETGMEISEEEFSKMEPSALQKLSLMLLMQSIKGATKRVNDNLPQIVAMILQRVIYGTFFAGANELRDIVEQPQEKFTAKEIREAIFQPEWERIKNLAGGSRGGSRKVKSTLAWDVEKTKQFYQAVQSFPRISKKPLWEYAQKQLSENDYDATTIDWLKSHPAFADSPENLLKEAATIWHSLEEEGKNIPAKSKPLAFAFRHACHKLGYSEQAYNTLRKRYYEGKKAVENEQ